MNRLSLNTKNMDNSPIETLKGKEEIIEKISRFEISILSWEEDNKAKEAYIGEHPDAELSMRKTIDENKKSIEAFKKGIEVQKAKLAELNK